MNGGLLGAPGIQSGSALERFAGEYGKMLWWNPEEGVRGAANGALWNFSQSALGMYGSTSPTLANSYGYAKAQTTSGIDANATFPRSEYQDIDFSQKIWIRMRLQCTITSSSHSEVYFRLQLGSPMATDGRARLDRKGFGFEINLGTYRLIAHNGTSVDVVDSGVAPSPYTSGPLHDVSVYSDGRGNVELNVNGVVVARSSHGPVGNGATSDIAITIQSGSVAELHYAHFSRNILTLWQT